MEGAVDDLGALIEFVIAEGFDVRVNWYPHNGQMFCARAVEPNSNMRHTGWGDTADEALRSMARYALANVVLLEPLPYEVRADWLPEVGGPAAQEIARVGDRP